MKGEVSQGMILSRTRGKLQIVFAPEDANGSEIA